MFEGIFQPMHLIVILIIALLFFGPSKLAGLGKGLGDAINGFKKAMKEGDPPPPQPVPPSAPVRQDETVQK
ncbi:MAG TPA: twin-arginine translocase TatA/TatE family subunit [Candidatus Angelobacter sp.]|jgi:sec-independent protein translocase protein TatA